MILVLVEAARKSGENVRRGRSLLWLRYDQDGNGSTLKGGELEEADRFTEKMKQLQEGHAETYKNQAETELSLDSICDKQKMSMVANWADDFFADRYLKSTEAVFEVTADLKVEVGRQVTRHTEYAKKVLLYDKTRIDNFDKLYQIVRLYSVLSFLSQVFKYKMRYHMVIKDEFQKMDFVTIVMGAKFSTQLLKYMPTQFFANIREYKKIRLDAKFIPLNKIMEEFGVKNIDLPKSFSKELTSSSTDLLEANKVWIANEVCSTIIQMFLTFSSTGYQSSLKELGVVFKDWKDGKPYVSEFYQSFFPILIKDFLPNGQLDDKGVNTQNSWDFCLGPNGSDGKGIPFTSMFQLTVFAKTGIVLPPKYNYIKFFSTAYLITVRNTVCVKGVPPPVLMFDFIIMGDAVLTPKKNFLGNIENAMTFGKLRYQLAFNLLQDFMNPLFAADMNLSETNYLSLDTFEAVKKGLDKDKQELVEDTFLILDYIYKVHISMRSKPEIKSTLKHNSEAVAYYKDMFDYMKMSANFRSLFTIGLTLAKVIGLYLPTMAYLCMKIDPKMNCGWEMTELKIIVNLHQITYTFTRKYMVTITTTITTQVTKAIIDDKIKEFETKLKLVKFESSYEAKSQLVVINLVEYNKWIEAIALLYTTTVTYEAACWDLMLIWVSTEENRLKNYHIVLEYFIYQFSVTIVKTAVKSTTFLLTVTDYMIIPIQLAHSKPDTHKSLLSFFTSIFDQVTFAKHIKIESEKEYSVLNGILYYGVLKGIEKYDKSKEKYLLTVFNDSIMSQMNIYTGDIPKIKTLLIENAAKLKELFEQKLTVDTFSGRIQHIWRVRLFLKLISFFVTYDAQTDLMVNLKDSPSQNPMVLIFNFFHFYTNNVYEYTGSEDFFYEFLNNKLNTCLVESQKYETIAFDVRVCKWSHRKYAELYYFVRNDVRKTVVVPGGIFDYFKDGENIIHARIFMACVHSDQIVNLEITNFCKESGSKNSQFCFAWLIKNDIWDHVQSMDSVSLSTEDFTAKLYAIYKAFLKVGTAPGLSPLEMKFGLLLASECISYFSDDNGLTFDRFQEFFDYSRVVLDKTQSKKELTDFYISKVYSLNVPDQTESAKAKSAYTKYLQLTYSKTEFNGVEAYSRYGVELLLSSVPETAGKIVKFGGMTNIYLFKALLLFAQSTDEYTKLATLLLNNESFLESSTINDKSKDDMINKIIGYVSCTKWSSEKEGGEKTLLIDSSKIKRETCKDTEIKESTKTKSLDYLTKLKFQLSFEIEELLQQSTAEILRVLNVSDEEEILVNTDVDDNEFLDKISTEIKKDTVIDSESFTTEYKKISTSTLSVSKTSSTVNFQNFQEVSQKSYVSYTFVVATGDNQEIQDALNMIKAKGGVIVDQKFLTDTGTTGKKTMFTSSESTSSKYMDTKSFMESSLVDMEKYKEMANGLNTFGTNVYGKSLIKDSNMQSSFQMSFNGQVVLPFKRIRV